MSTKTIAILAALAVLALLLVAASPAPPPRPPRAATPAQPAAAPEPPTPHPEDHVFFLSAGGTWLGVQIADIDEDRARELGLKEEMGAEIQEVVPDGPAAEAGLKEGDVIVEYQGAPVQGVAQLTRMVRETPAGRAVRLKVFRDGSAREATVKVTKREWGPEFGKRITRRMEKQRVVIPEINIPEIEIPDIPGFEGMGHMRSSPRLGVMVDNLTDQLGEFFGVRDGAGVLVRSVRKGSPAEAAGLRAGDVIIKVDGERVTGAADLRGALRQRRDRDVAITIVRDRKEQTVKVAPPRGGERARPKGRVVEEDADEEDPGEEDIRDHDMEQSREEVERIKRDLRREIDRIHREAGRLKLEARRLAQSPRTI